MLKTRKDEKKWYRPGSTLVARELARHLVPGALDGGADAALRVGACSRRGRVLALGLLALLDEVAGAAAADVVDGGGVLAEAFLLSELLVKGEHGAFLLAVDVAGAAASAGEEGVGGGRAELDARCWTSGVVSGGDVLGDAGYVSSSAATVVDGGRGGGGVRLGDVVGDHVGGVLWGGWFGWCSVGR